MTFPAQSYSIIFSAFLSASGDGMLQGYAATKAPDGKSYVTATTAAMTASATGVYDGIALRSGSAGTSIQIQRDAKVDKEALPWIGAGIVENAVVDSNGKVQRASAASGTVIGICDKEGNVSINLSGAVSTVSTNLTGDVNGPIDANLVYSISGNTGAVSILGGAWTIAATVALALTQPQATGDVRVKDITFHTQPASASSTADNRVGGSFLIDLGASNKTLDAGDDPLAPSVSVFYSGTQIAAWRASRFFGAAGVGCGLELNWNDNSWIAIGETSALNLGVIAVNNNVDAIAARNAGNTDDTVLIGTDALDKVVLGRHGASAIKAVPLAGTGTRPVYAQADGTLTTAASSASTATSDVNSLVVGDISLAEWQPMLGGTAPFIRANDSTATADGFADGVEINWPNNAGTLTLETPFAPPPGVTAVEFQIDARQGGAGASTLGIEIWDITGVTRLAHAACVLTTTPTTFTTGSVAVTPGTFYIARIRMGSGDATNPASGIVSRARVKPVTASDSFWTTSFVRYNASQKLLWDQTREGMTTAGSVSSVPYRRQSGAARMRVRTTATKLGVQAFNLIGGIGGVFASDGQVVVYVNGRAYATLAIAVNKHDVQFVTLPSGQNNVELVGSGCVKNVAAERVGTPLLSVLVAQTDELQVIPPAAMNERIIVYGDSKDAGFFATAPALGGWPALLRRMIPSASFVDECAASAQLYDECGTATGRQQLVARLAQAKPTKLFVTIGSNDWRNGGINPTQYGALLASFLDDFHMASPGTAIFCCTTWPESAEGPNGLGFTLPNYRTAMQTTAAARAPWVTFLDGTTVPGYNPVLYTTDGIHPSDKGASLISAWLMAALDTYSPTVAPIVTPVAYGGTGLASPGASGNVLTSNGTAWVSSAPAATGPGGSNTQMQFNDSSAFGGAVGLTWTKATSILNAANGVAITFNTTPAHTGDLRHGRASQSAILETYRNNADTADVVAIQSTTADELVFGDATNCAQARLASNTTCGMYIGGDRFNVTSTTATFTVSTVAIGAAVVTHGSTVAASGDYRAKNAWQLNFRNAANSADLTGVHLDGSNILGVGGDTSQGHQVANLYLQAVTEIDTWIGSTAIFTVTAGLAAVRSGQNFAVGNFAASMSSATNCMYIKDGTQPTGAPTTGVYMGSDSGSLHFRSSFSSAGVPVNVAFIEVAGGFGAIDPDHAIKIVIDKPGSAAQTRYLRMYT